MTSNFWLITFFFMMTLHTVQGQSGNHIPESRQEQTMPEFPGGEYLLSDFISKELKYPANTVQIKQTAGSLLDSWLMKTVKLVCRILYQADNHLSTVKR